MSRTLYTYSTPATEQPQDARVTYTYEAVEYRITMEDEGAPGVSTGPTVVLRSRGSGHGTGQGFFDVYIENEDSSTEVIKGDPVWYHFDTDLEETLEAALSEGMLRGYLTSADSQYWMDIDGGSEMGGKTFKLITGSLDPDDVPVENLGHSFVSAFALQYTDVEALLREILLYPVIKSERIDSLCPTGEGDCSQQDLESHACVGANGFLGQVNIASVINLLSQPLNATVEYYDLGGISRGSVDAVIGANLKQDFIINDMGLEADTVGTVCVTVNAEEGAWMGGIA